MMFDERATFDAMMTESWQGTLQSRDAAKRLVAKLRDAEQAHVPWAVAELEALLMDGARARCRTWWQTRQPKVETRDGKTIKTAGGTRRRDTVTGDMAFEQLAFADMERPQLEDHITMLVRQTATEESTIRALRRLLNTMDEVPEAKTPREACIKLGTTVEAVMAGGVPA